MTDIFFPVTGPSETHAPLHSPKVEMLEPPLIHPTIYDTELLNASTQFEDRIAYE